MKKTTTVMMVLGAVLLVGTLSLAVAPAQALRVNVPFEFYVGKDLLPAGEYIFDMQSPTGYSATASSVLIRDGSGEALRWIWTMPNQVLPRDPANQLTFHRYGDTHFLAKIECNGYTAGLKVTPQERELLAEVITIK